MEASILTLNGLSRPATPEVFHGSCRWCSSLDRLARLIIPEAARNLSLGNKAAPVLVPTHGPETCSSSVPDQGRGTPARYEIMEQIKDEDGSDCRSRSGQVSVCGLGGIQPSSCADALACGSDPALRKGLTWQAGAARSHLPGDDA